MYFNSTRDYSVFNNVDMEYIYESILKQKDINEMKYDNGQENNIVADSIEPIKQNLKRM